MTTTEEPSALNPLKSIARILSPKGWVHYPDIAVIVGFNMKLAGIDWRTDEQLKAILTELLVSRFLQVDPIKITFRLNPVYHVERAVPMELPMYQTSNAAEDILCKMAIPEAERTPERGI